MAELVRTKRATASCINRKPINLYSAFRPLKHVCLLWRYPFRIQYTVALFLHRIEVDGIVDFPMISGTFPRTPLVTCPRGRRNCLGQRLIA
jgi:hypothetical protein